MNRTVGSVAATAAAAMALGTAAYVMTSKNMKSQRKKMKKAVNKAVKTVGNVAQDLSRMIG